MAHADGAVKGVGTEATDLVARGEPPASEVDVESQPLVGLRARLLRRTWPGEARDWRGVAHARTRTYVRVRGHGGSVQDLDRPTDVAAQIPGVDGVQAAEGRVQEVGPCRIEHQLTDGGQIPVRWRFRPPCVRLSRGRGAWGNRGKGTHL